MLFPSPARPQPAQEEKANQHQTPPASPANRPQDPYETLISSFGSVPTQVVLEYIQLALTQPHIESEKAKPPGQEFHGAISQPELDINFGESGCVAESAVTREAGG